MIELFTLLLLYMTFLGITVFFYRIAFPPPPKPAPVKPSVAINFPCHHCKQTCVEKKPDTVLSYSSISGWANYYVCKACVKKVELEDSWTAKEEVE